MRDSRKLFRRNHFGDNKCLWNLSTLTANIRQRRGSKVDIRLPLFIDENTRIPNGRPRPALSSISPRTSLQSDFLFSCTDEKAAGSAKPLPGFPYIHMDAMAFGMGCCCLQITFQAWNVDEARKVYDALVPVAPVMVRLPISNKNERIHVS